MMAINDDFEVGCLADGSLGHDHIRSTLADLLMSYCPKGKGKLRKELLGPMSDDAAEEDVALDALNEHCDPGFTLMMRDGDLVLYCDLLEVIEEHGDVARAAIDYHGEDYAREDTDCIRRMCEEGFLGCFDSAEEWAEQHIDDCGMLNNMPENLRHYFDYEAFAIDCDMSGDINAIEFEGSVYIFNGRI